MDMIDVSMILIVSLLAAFVVLLVKKWGWAEWVQVHGNEFFARLFSCDLCMGFWSAVVICMMIAVVTGDTRYVLLPVLTTPLTRMMV